MKRNPNVVDVVMFPYSPRSTTLDQHALITNTEWYAARKPKTKTQKGVNVETEKLLGWQ